MLLANEYELPIVITDDKKNPTVFSYGLHSYHKLTKNILKQIKWLNNDKTIDVTRKIIKQKITNQYKLLEYENKDSKSIDLLKGYVKELEQLKTRNQITNKEAIASKVYFRALFNKEFVRDQENEINRSLNYGYAILRSKIKAQIISKGLHPSIGIFHYSQFNNYNLADDIIEVYRAIVDYVVYHLQEIDGEFTKIERQKLQQVILQEVTIEEQVQKFDYSVNLFIQSVIDYMDDSSEQLKIPKVEIDHYEY